MKNFFYLLPLALCGCGTLPSTWSAYNQFLHERPKSTILTMTKQEVIDPAHTPLDSETRRYADFIFLYRNAQGEEHEEIWEYNHSAKGWFLVKKEQTR